MQYACIAILQRSQDPLHVIFDFCGCAKGHGLTGDFTRFFIRKFADQVFGFRNGTRIHAELVQAKAKQDRNGFGHASQFTAHAHPLPFRMTGINGLPDETQTQQDAGVGYNPETFALPRSTAIVY